MSDTSGLIVYKINGWKITTMEIRGGGVLEYPEHPPGHVPEWKGLKDILKNVFIQQKMHLN